MKVWVLEKFASPTELIKTLIDMIEIVESSRNTCSEEDSKKLDEGLDRFEDKIEKNPFEKTTACFCRIPFLTVNKHGCHSRSCPQSAQN